MADVCLVLEGTYPYVTGGVSAWIHDIVSSLPDITFDIVAIVPSKAFAREYKYKLPPNIYSIKNIYLNDSGGLLTRGAGYFGRKPFFDELWREMEKIRANDTAAVAEVKRLFEKYRPSVDDFLRSTEGWEFFTKIYNEFNPDFSFLDFFWTLRFVMIPLVNIASVAPPECRCFHTVSTGYAGLLGSFFAAVTGKKLFLTEHGIYTNERLLEIVDAKWIYDENRESADAMKELSPLKKFWIGLFVTISHITYHYSEMIITLYRGNQQLQLKYGADPSKCHIIPNGIDVGRFSKKRPAASSGPKYTVGFVGRVVPIKDVKTLIHAARFVVDKLPQAVFQIKGPVDEDRHYYEECRILVDLLGLSDNVFFLPPSDVSEFYKDLDLLVLSSVSEAQPLAVLEANLCSVPVVSTDVGAVRELVFGIDSDDTALGPSGIVVPVKSPQALGDEIVRILSDRKLNEEMGATGVKRVLDYYKKDDLMERYRKIYESMMG